MDQKFLKRLIAECPLNNFTEDENSAKRHQILDDYLEKFTDSLYKNEDQLMENFWSDYIGSSEVGMLLSSKMLRRCFIYLDCAVAVYNYIAKKSKEKKNTELAKHISIQLQNDLNQFKSMLLLAMNGCLNSLIMVYRSLYESFVIGQYLVQNPDLVPTYNAHAQFLRYRLTQVVGNSKPEWDKKYNEYIKEYGEEFVEDYGWTKSKLPNKKDRKLGTLAKACKLEGAFSKLYKFSCSYVHSSAFSVSSRPDLNQMKAFFNASMHIIESEITDYIRELNIPTKEGVILRNILIFLWLDFEKI